MRYSIQRQCIDKLLAVLLLIAVLLGCTLLYSANSLSMSLVYKQLIKGSLALVFFLGLAYIKERDVRDLAIPLYIFSIILLIAVLFLGYQTKGAQRWLNFYFFRFEPSELVKITLPLALASLIHKARIPIRGLTLLKAIVMIAIPFFLVLKQPDLGTALIISFIGGIMIFIAGLSRKIIITSILGLTASLPLLWHQLHAYQKQRIMTLISDVKDLKHHGYHIHQSKIAIGSGGFWGKGFGLGDQVQLGFIPEHKTDFIFTVLSEEFGYFGVLFWLTLVLTIGLRCIYLGYKQPQVFNKLICITLGASFMLNAWINMSMVSGMLPVVGIPLPLLSYGGTSFVATLISFAIILKFGHTDPKKQHIW